MRVKMVRPVTQSPQPETISESPLVGCPTCGQVQRLPPVSVATGRGRKKRRPVCVRCEHTLLVPHGPNRWTPFLALAGLALYPPAILLPMLGIERLGHFKEDSLLSGVVTLLGEGYWFVGIIVLLFSILLPPVKLFCLLLLTARIRMRDHHRAQLFHAVEALGKWGMLDVMLVAILVAYVKLGDLVSISAGPGVVAFACLVLLSLLAGISFNPHRMWASHSQPKGT